MDTERMLKQLYVPPKRRLAHGRARSAKLAVKRWIRDRSLHIAGSVLLAFLWVGLHIYYYNYLKALEFDVHVSSAQIEVMQARRHRVQQNLTRIVAQYSAYEDKLLTTLTAMRASGQTQGGGAVVQRPLGLHGANDAAAATPAAGSVPNPVVAPNGSLPGALPGGTAMAAATVASDAANVCTGPAVAAAPSEPVALAPAAPRAAAPSGLVPTAPAPSAPGLNGLPPTANLEELLSRLRVVAEQYPELQLGASLQQLASAIIELETEVGQRIVSYNEAVNNYITVVDTFPGIIFARLSGFPRYEFYPVGQEQKEFQEVAF